MAWKRWSLWTLLVALVVSMLVTMVWLAGRYEASQVQEKLERDTANAVAISVQRWAAICRTCWR
jgi:two-component system sensor histidine kinase DctS